MSCASESSSGDIVSVFTATVALTGEGSLLKGEDLNKGVDFGVGWESWVLSLKKWCVGEWGIGRIYSVERG